MGIHDKIVERSYMVSFNSHKFCRDVYGDDVAKIEKRLSKLDENERISQIQIALTGKRRIHLHLCREKQRVLKAMIRTTPPADHFKLFLIKDDSEQNLIEFAVRKYDKSIANMWSSIPKTNDEHMKIFERNPNNPHSPLHYAIKKGSYRIAKALISGIPPVNYMQVITSTSLCGSTPFHCVAQRTNSAALIRRMIKPIPPEEVYGVIAMTDISGRTCIDRASDFLNVEAVDCFLDSITETDIEKIIDIRDVTGLTVLNTFITGRSIELFQSVLKKTITNRVRILDAIEQTIQTYPLLPEQFLRELSRMTSLELPRLTPNIHFKQCRRDRLILLAKDSNTLRKTCDLIKAYTLTIHPHRQFKEIRIKDTPKVKHLQLGYNCYTSIHSILPTNLCRSYGLRSEDWLNNDANCHGSALVAMGLCSQISFISIYEYITSILLEHTQRVPLEDISVGDYVLLTGLSQDDKLLHNWGRSHSLIYLSPELCISMNGRTRPLMFYPTRYVVSGYDYPKDALETSFEGVEKPRWAADIEVYRRRPHRQRCPVNICGVL